MLNVFLPGILYAPKANAEEPRNINVVASFYPMYIIALNVCKDVPGVTVENLTPPTTGCLHDYSITTNDMKKLVGADILVANGAGMESFLDKVVAQYHGIKIVILSEGISLINDNAGDNPHVWVSISDYIFEVKNLVKAMVSFDPVHKELYIENEGAYIAKLEKLRLSMNSELALFKGKKIVTFHEAFPYFAREFGLDIAAVVEREPGSQPSAKELAETVDLIKRSGIKTLFAEPQYPATAADTIAKETGASVYVLDPAVAGPDDPDAYLNIMESNLIVLRKALAQ